MENTYATPAPGTYKLVLLSFPKRDYRKSFSIGPFAGADLKVLEYGPLKYERQDIGAKPPHSYLITRVPVKLRNDGDLPAYPYLFLDIEKGKPGSSDPFTVGESALGGSGIWARGVNPGETVAGWFAPAYEPYFDSGSYLAKYTFYHKIYRANLSDWVKENIAIFEGTVNFP